MEKFLYNYNNYFFNIIILISLIIFCKNEIRKVNFIYPLSFTLLDNSNVLICNNGIHFYNEDFSVEDSDKKQEISIELADLDKITMTQFSSEDGGYILITVKNILYIFDNNKELKKNYNLTEEINTDQYQIIPYKKDNNILYFIIPYIESLQLVLSIFQYDLNNLDSDFIINKKRYTPVYDNGYLNSIIGLSCIFMSYSSEINTIFTCFLGIVYPYKLYSTSLNPENDFTEIESLRAYQDIEQQQPSHIIAATDENKQKIILLITTFSHFLYSLTYDFTNNFSTPNNEILGTNAISISDVKHVHKLLYFKQREEFVMSSGLAGCDKLIIVYNKDFTLNYKGVLNINQSNEGCTFSYSFTLFYYGSNYIILTDGGNNSTSIFKSLENDFEIFAKGKVNAATNSPTNHIDITEYEYEDTEFKSFNLNTINLKTDKISSVITNLETDSQTIKNVIETEIHIIPTTYIETDVLTENKDKITETNYLTEKYEENVLGNIKCKTSTSESASYNLCTSCNIEKDYFPAQFPKEDFLNGFIECYNNFTKPINFYFDYSDKKYKACYETCETCIEGGDGKENKCLTCDFNHKKKVGTTNCATDCLYLYYYNSFGQYKCTNYSFCPEEANLYIKELKKCTNDCYKESLYQYGGRCLEKCPNDTSSNDRNICIEDNNICEKSEIIFQNEEEVITNIKTYAKEFYYTSKHVSFFHNNTYSLIIYKDLKCIEELSIDISKIDFTVCLKKIQNNLYPPTNLSIIMALFEKANGKNKPTISYSFYHPETGEKINNEIICKDDVITVKGNLVNQINNSGIKLDSLLFLTNQDINVFNIDDIFYTDICYHFESPNGKDVPLKDRIKHFFPNITLCNSGCSLKGVNLTSMESICECTFNNFFNSKLIEENALISNAIGEVTELLSESNFFVLKCYKDIFNIKYILKNVGGFIILGILLLEIIFAIIFIFFNNAKIRNFLYNLTKYYMTFNTINIISQKKNNSLNNSNISSPPPKIRKFKTKKHKSRKSKFSKFRSSLDSNKTEDVKTIGLKNSFIINSNTFLEKKEPKIIFKKINFNKYNLLKLKKNCGNIDMDDYLKTDLDDLEYEDAIKKDKRSFCEFFCQRLYENQIILNTFCFKDNLRPMSIKIILQLLTIDLYFVINGLFFSEEYLSELFNSNEKETFFSYIPRSYDRFFKMTIVGFIIEVIIDCIFIEEKKVKRIFIREKDDPIQLKYEIAMIIKSLKVRYIILIFISFVIAIFSWFYVNCFNNTFPGVKIEWIKSSITIILIVQILSILSVFLEAILRTLSFTFKSENLYKAIQYIP